MIFKMDEVEIDKKEPGRELDALVWKALNGQRLTIVDCRWTGKEWQPYAGYPVGHISPLHYSTDITTAFEVLETFTDLEIEKSGDNWTVLLVSGGLVRVTRPSLPHAVCLALLMFVSGS